MCFEQRRKQKKKKQRGKSIWKLLLRWWWWLECGLLTSFGVNLKKVGGNGHNSGGSHLFELADEFDGWLPVDDGNDGHFTFGEAPVMRFVVTVVELIGTIKSSSTTFDLFCDDSPLWDGVFSSSFRSFSF